MSLMRIVPTQVHKNNLITQYRNHETNVMKYFNYKPFGSLQKRYEYVMEQTYNRDGLIHLLTACNQLWGCSEETIEQIHRLNDPQSVVVVGGQQAGLLTGPTYTLNKVISIIIFAKQQEKLLNIPVVPIFWIAGEDHDYDEINHTYVIEKMHLEKKKNQQNLYKKQSLSNVEMEKTFVTNWMNDIFQTLQETQYTKEVYQTLLTCIEQSTTYVDFFARLIHHLFQHTGIVLMDSGDDQVRQLEKDMFSLLVDQQEQIANNVYEAKNDLIKAGYTINVDLDREDAHLFYRDEHDERILLKRENNDWLGKNNEIRLTTEQIKTFINEHPERFSNNVMTRPLMQEYLLPTLAFIAGDGEITYWATLKQAFHCVQMEMPPVIPRLSFTYITNHMEKILAKRQLHAEEVIDRGTKHERDEWFNKQQDATVDVLIEEVWKKIEQAHKPIRDWANDFSDDMGGLAQKNLLKMKQQMQFMERRMNTAVKEKYSYALNEFAQLEYFLRPKGGLQERIWSPLLFMNLYGVDWILHLLDEDFSFTENHYLIYLT